MTKEFDYEQLTYEDRENIHNALAETTLKHIDGSNGLFEANPFDPAKSPSQMLEIVHLNPAPTKREEISKLSDFASPNLSPYIREGLARQPAMLDTIRNFLNEGIHIFPVTTHQKIQDVAIWGANLSDNLEDEHWQDQMGHIISRGVTTIKAFEMAASEVLEKDGHVFMSFPRTPTIEELGFDDLLIDTNNKRMRKEVHSWLEEDLIHRLFGRKIGKALNIAWSGKTDKIVYGDDHQPESITLGSVSLGTLDIIKRGLVLPVVLWDGENPVFEMGGLTPVKKASDVIRIQQWQARTLAQKLDIKESAVSLESA